MRFERRYPTYCLLAAALLWPHEAAQAQSVQKPAAAQAAPKKDPNVALKALEAGGKAYTAGKLDAAIEQLTVALANGGLPPPKMAQAYYTRGLVYKKQKKPAQALSDLTVAVWVNGGLNEADRAAAMDARNQVYRDAGLGDQAPPIANAVGTPSPSATPAAAAPPPAPAAVAAAAPAPVAAPPAPVETPAVAAPAPPPTAPASTTAERPVWQADVDSPPPAPVATAEAAPAAAPVANSPSTASDAYVPPPPAPSASLAPAPATPQPSGSDTLSPLAKAGDSISGFFSNMFGQGQKPPPPTTGSTAAGSGPGWVPVDPGARPEGPAAQVSASEPQRAPGFEVATVTPAAGAASNAPAGSAPPAISQPAVRAASGKYRLQLASVRSREEADRLVEVLKAQHAAELGAAEAHVDEAVIGNMGTFYRVRLGPYADANEPKKLCTTLKPQGYDCQVVTQ